VDDYSAYRYGFNQGSEKDDEIKGAGNSYTTFFRQYDPRLGRWLSVDPKFNETLDQSTYCSFNDNPILYSDPYGDKVPVTLNKSARKEFGISKKEAKNYTPDMIKDLFREEYNIDVDIKDGYLYYKGDVTSNGKMTISETARNMWINELKEFDDEGNEYISNHSIEFEYGNSKVDLGYNVSGDGIHSSSVIDLGDFNGESDLFTSKGDKYMLGGDGSYTLEQLKRSFNLARVMEHEYFGHGMKKYEDNWNHPNSQTPAGFNQLVEAGYTVKYVNVTFRKEMGLPYRTNYYAPMALQFKDKDGQTHQMYQILFQGNSKVVTGFKEGQHEHTGKPPGVK